MSDRNENSDECLDELRCKEEELREHGYTEMLWPIDEEIRIAKGAAEWMKPYSRSAAVTRKREEETGS